MAGLKIVLLQAVYAATRNAVRTISAARARRPATSCA